MNKMKLRKLTIASVFAALTCVLTMLIQIPTPTKGYVNLGDCIVNVSAWLLGPAYGAAAAGFGSAAADIFSGYVIYAPATLIIKSLMAFFCFAVYNVLAKKFSSFSSRIAAAVVSELIMLAGYFVFDFILYSSLATAVAGMTSSVFQGIMGAASSVVLYEAVIKRIPMKNFQIK